MSAATSRARIRMGREYLAGKTEKTMARRLGVRTLLVAVVVSSPLARGAEPPEPTAEIVLRVLDRATRKPVEGASLVSPGGKESDADRVARETLAKKAGMSGPD